MAFVKDLAFGALAALSRPERIRHQPLSVQVEPTTACNLSCRMCIRNSRASTARHMESPIFDLALKKLKPRRILFAGAGEPLLHPRLGDMVESCRTKGVRTTVTTNLAHPFPVVERLVEAGIDGLKISVDAADRKTYGIIRCEEANFDRVLDNLRRLRARPGRKPDLRFEHVIMKENMTGIADFVRLARNEGVERIYFRELQTEGMTEEQRRALVAEFDFDGLRKSLGEGLMTATALKVGTNLGLLLHHFDQLVDIYNRATLPSLSAGCLLPWLQIYVAVNGDVAPCCALYTNSGIKTGNVVDNTADELLNGTAIQCVRKAFKNGKLPPVCRDCMPRDARKLLAMARILPGYMG